MNTTQLEKDKIINTLKASLSYSDLVSKVKTCESSTNKIMNLDFQGSLFSEDEKFRFPHTWESAFLILTKCTLFTNSKDLLTSYHFKDELNLHTSSYSLIEENEDYAFVEFTDLTEENFKNSEFAKSELSKEDYFSTLKISTWSYENLVISATFFYLEYIHAKCIEKKLFLTTSNTLPLKTGRLDEAFTDLQVASSYIALLLLSQIFGKKLFLTLKKTNFFLVYPKIWISGFSMFIKGYGENSLYDYESQNNNYFFNKIQKNNLLNFSHIFFYLKAFDFLIPKKIRKVIFLTCYNTHSIHILYYILKKYINIFDYSIKPELKQYNDYALNSKLSFKLLQLVIQEDK